jgi:hypothetical protein
MDHGSARSRRTDDCLCPALFEDLDEPLGNLPRFYTITCIERRLPTTRLALVKLNLAACPPQHRDTARSDVAPQLINETGDEERNEHIVDFRFSIFD